MLFAWTFAIVFILVLAASAGMRVLIVTTEKVELPLGKTLLVAAIVASLVASIVAGAASLVAGVIG